MSAAAPSLRPVRRAHHASCDSGSCSFGRVPTYDDPAAVDRRHTLPGPYGIPWRDMPKGYGPWGRARRRSTRRARRIGTSASGQAAACHGEKLRLERLQALGQAPLVALLPDRLIKGAGVGGRR